MTNSQARKLGDRLREKIKSSTEVTVEDLLSLQEYRKTYEDALAKVFEDLSFLSKNIRKDRIVTYRIKRLDSIISKLKREDTRELDRMWDIGGCRCILPTQASLDKVYNDIKQRFNIRREKNYIKDVKYDGYSSVHLYVDVPHFNKVIEIQLRTIKQHNWATLVEIVDLVFEKRIKEGEKNTPFNDFHLLLSKMEDLTYEERKKLIQIEVENKIFEKLFNIFLRNYIEVRSNWIQIEEKGHNFFIIEVDKETKPVIKSYANENDAQREYFESYLKTDNNIVLTHLENPNYKQICLAYSNYILTTHQFISDWHVVLKDIIIYADRYKIEKDIHKYAVIFNDYFSIGTSAIQEEMRGLDERIKEQEKSNQEVLSLSKARDWIEDLNQRMTFRRNIQSEIRGILDAMDIKQEPNFYEKIKRVFGFN